MKKTIKYLLALVFASCLFVGCTTTIGGGKEAKRWEYKSVSFDPSSDVQLKLNELGKEGWQLVSIVPYSVQDFPGNNDRRELDVDHALYIFKRPLH